jgi:hypothetical protein
MIMTRFYFYSAAFLTLACVQAARSEVAPDPNRGLYAVWADPAVANGLPFIKGRQVVLQWASVQPAEDRYDFTDLHRQLAEIADAGRVATVQLNANAVPAFLYEKTPYKKEQLAKSQDKRGTLQYWHPYYVEAYTNAIAAFAREVKADPHHSSVAGVRLSYDAIGTEFMIVPQADRDPKGWITPAGATSGPAWTEEIAASYRRTILEAYLRSFSPDIRVLMRTHVALYNHPDQESLRVAETGTGKLGFLYTAADMEAKTPAQEEVFQTVFLRYCRTGKLVCYAEQVSDSEARRPPLKDKRWSTPAQWNYWRLLADLNLGFSLIANHGLDLEKAGQPEYKAAFEFAARYAGYHASPSVAPGAWVALREGSRYLKGDYTFLMRRLPGAEMKAEEKIGPDDQRFGAWAMTLPKGAEVKFELDPEFARGLKKAAVRVVYLDRGAGTFTVHAAGREFPAKLTGSGRWKTAEFDANQPGAKLAITTDTELTLHMVEVVRKSDKK